MMSLYLVDDIPELQRLANLQVRHPKHVFAFEFVELLARDLIVPEQHRCVVVSLLMEEPDQVLGRPSMHNGYITT